MVVFLVLIIYLINFVLLDALVAELVDALDSKSSSFGSVGSIPTQGTKMQFVIRIAFFLGVAKTLAFASLKTRQGLLSLLLIRGQWQ